MKRFVEGQDRSQLILLPDCLDDYVGEDNPVRIVDAFIDELDLAVLGFAGVVPEATGRPSCHPVTLLKIYLYGYLNRVQSSRRLERTLPRSEGVAPCPVAPGNVGVRNGTGRASRPPTAASAGSAAQYRADVADRAAGARLQDDRRQMQSLKEMEQTVHDAPDQQVSLTDPDARSMATSGKGTATVGYNVQIAVDA